MYLQPKQWIFSPEINNAYMGPKYNNCLIITKKDQIAAHNYEHLMKALNTRHLTVFSRFAYNEQINGSIYLSTHGPCTYILTIKLLNGVAKSNKAQLFSSHNIFLTFSKKCRTRFFLKELFYWILFNSDYFDNDEFCWSFLWFVFIYFLF